MLETLTLQTAYQALMLTNPEVHTSLFLNLWLWAVHDICIGNKKSRLRNTLLNTQTHTQILYAQQRIKHSVVRNSGSANVGFLQVQMI
jgi:hypothetical protein